MNGERWQRIKQVLDEAIPLEKSERSSLLERACQGDAELRRELESLLASHDQAGTGFLAKPAANLKAALSVSQAGRRIGAYQVLEQIGQGGMGEVYRAVRADGQFTKEVALKIVRGGFDSASIQERFRNERQILASLDHPNIARLLDGGTTAEGVPYLVMELIEGKPIDAYCDEHKLNVTERLQLFRQVCGAVQFAHQRLVIHRDIKPNNILVTEEGVPKLLDFGIAKILDAGGASPETTLARPMTPEYASPEQIRSEPITTATDVYSLGVVLYLVLTGRSPYPGDTRTAHSLAQAICETEAGRPSTAFLKMPGKQNGELARETAEEIGRVREGSSTKLRRRLSGDVDNILLMALRKEPSRRYASAEQFSEDIRRHLEGLPVIAARGSWSYRAGKFVSRHKAGVAATAAAALILAAGVSAIVREARIASENQRKAEKRFNDVRRLANSFLFEFDDKIKNLPGSTPARSLLVKRALEYLDGLASEAHGDVSLQLEIAHAYQKVAEVQGNPIYPNLGDSEGALESSRKSMAILESLTRTEPEDEQARQLLAGNHQQISDVLSFSGDTAGAVEHSGEALKLYEGLAASLASDARFQAQRVTQTYHYANLLMSVGRLDEAGAEYGRAAELSRQMIVARPSDPEGKVHLATSLDGLGYVLHEKGDTAGALENRREGLALREQLAKLDANNAHYGRQAAFSHHNVGLSLVEEGDLASALTNFRMELSIFESLSMNDPKNVQGRRNLSLAHKQIGGVLMRTGDYRKALSEFRTALDIDRDLSGIDPRNSQAALDLSISESKAGSALGKLGQYREALAMLRSGIARQEALLAADPSRTILHDELATSYARMADCLADSHDSKLAIQYYRKAVDRRVELSQKSPAGGANRGALAECYTSLASVLAPRDRADALKQYSSAIELLEPLTTTDRSNAQDRVTLADALSNSARLYMRIAGEEPTKSLQYWTKARSFDQRSLALLLGLQKAGKLSPDKRRSIQEVNGELTRCNDSLARLSPMH